MPWDDVLKLFRQLKGRVADVNTLVQDFRTIREQNASIEPRGVYLWRVQKPFARVQGYSDVIMVGQTSNGAKRWRFSTSDANQQENQLFYGHVLGTYGFMTVWWAAADALSNVGLGGATKTQECSVLQPTFANSWIGRRRTSQTMPACSEIVSSSYCKVQLIGALATGT
jgi:hypothetical protein